MEHLGRYVDSAIDEIKYYFIGHFTYGSIIRAISIANSTNESSKTTIFVKKTWTNITPIKPQRSLVVSL